MNSVCMALNICTYRRPQELNRILNMIQNSAFCRKESGYYGTLHVFIVDNSSEMKEIANPFFHLFHNKNTGGSGGFQRGIEEIRKSNIFFSHVIFMDDDVVINEESLYILCDFLKSVDKENSHRPVAGRMFDLDNPSVQWTAAEKWNGGDILHYEFLRSINEENYTYGKVDYSADAEYGGWWFCCFPMEFVSKNDILPFFIHCDDVEYGLRCGERPIVIEGVQVWHQTWEKKYSPIIMYYDYRNSLFVNQLYDKQFDVRSIYVQWKEKISFHHVNKEYYLEYLLIRALGDFLRGLDWLSSIDSAAYHIKMNNIKTNKIRNAIAWRWVSLKFRKKYKLIKVC